MAWLLAFPLLTAWGRDFRVNMIPNGSKFRCQNCHVSANGGGARNAFGLAVFGIVQGSSRTEFWGPELAALDSDGDGFTNGEELGDPDGDKTVIVGFSATNPGNANSKPAVNTPPTVTLGQPANGAVIRQSATFNLEATATDTGGSVAKVEFLLNGSVVATQTAAPFVHPVDSTALAVGEHQFTARATDNLGLTTTAPAAAFSVIGPLVMSPPTPLANGSLEFTWAAIPGATYTVESSADLNAWNPAGTVVASGPTASFTDTAVGEATVRFYRALETQP